MRHWIKAAAIFAVISIVAYRCMPEDSSGIHVPKTFSINDYINFGYFSKYDYYTIALFAGLGVFTICLCTFVWKVVCSPGGGPCSRVRPTTPTTGPTRRIIIQ